MGHYGYHPSKWVVSTLEYDNTRVSWHPTSVYMSEEKARAAVLKAVESFYPGEKYKIQDLSYNKTGGLRVNIYVLKIRGTQMFRWEAVPGNVRDLEAVL